MTQRKIEIAAEIAGLVFGVGIWIVLVYPPFEWPYQIALSIVMVGGWLILATWTVWLRLRRRRSESS